MSEEKKELKEAEAEKVTGGAWEIAFKEVIEKRDSICDNIGECIGNICPQYDSCTKSIKK